MAVKDTYSLKESIREKNSPKKRSFQIGGTYAALIFIVTFLIYTPALKNDFVWDDLHYISENTMIRSWSIHSLYEMLTSLYAGNWHPLTWLTHAIDYALWGLNPSGHHLTNIIMHGLNALLVFFLTIRLAVRAKEINEPPLFKREHSISTRVLIMAGVTALLFGLHPLHVESVVWVSERKDLLCAFFFLLTLLSYLSYASPDFNKHRWGWFTLCLLLFICALMSKPMAVTLPLVLLLMDIYPLKRISLHLAKNSRHASVLLEKIPFFILSIASSAITIIAQHSGEAIRSLEQFHLDARLLNALRSLVFYLGKMLIPTKLIPFYPFPTHTHWLDLQYLLSALLVLITTGFCVWMVKRGNCLLFTVWSYYVITLLPVLGIIQVGNQAAADRYTYLPSLSIFLLLGVGVLRVFESGILASHKVIRGGVVLTCICIFTLLGQLTNKQIKLWRNSEVFWSYAISAFPQTFPEAHNNLGFFYHEKGMLDEAISQYKKALTIQPRYADAHVNLGNAYDQKGMLDEAIVEYKKAIAFDPNHEEAHYNLGNAYLKEGSIERAIAEYKKVIAINPNYAEAHNNLGNAFGKKGIIDEEISEYKKAIAINPNLAEAHNNLGFIYNGKGMFDEAIYEFKKALANNPQYAGAHNNLGTVYYKKGELDNAISEYKQSIAIKPHYANAHYNLGVAYYSKRDYKLALTHFEKVSELGVHVNPRILELLRSYQ